MWESPIKIYEAYVDEMVAQMQQQKEEKVMLTITQSMGCDIDKEELVKALNYDREQYSKGYKDAKAEILAKVEQAKEEIEHLDGTTDDYNRNGEVVFRNMVDVVEVLAILDKLISESEDLK